MSTRSHLGCAVALADDEAQRWNPVRVVCTPAHLFGSTLLPRSDVALPNSTGPVLSATVLGQGDFEVGAYERRRGGRIREGTGKRRGKGEYFPRK
jgi:hypothetical protein